MSASQTFCRSRPPLKKYRPCTVYMRSSITIAPPLHAAKAERERGLGREKRWRFSCPNSPEAREIKHTLKYDRLKLPTTFFTDKYGQVRTQTDICEKIKHLDKLLFGEFICLCVTAFDKDFSAHVNKKSHFDKKIIVFAI